MSLSAKIVVLLAAVLLALGGAWRAYVSGEKAGKAQVQAQWDADKLAHANALAQETAKGLKKERALQAMADKKRKELANEVTHIAAERDAALAGLRERDQRASVSNAPDSAGADAGPSAPRCTGAGLFREDAEFLIGEAARANRLRAELKKCLAQGREIEQQLNE